MNHNQPAPAYGAAPPQHHEPKMVQPQINEKSNHPFDMDHMPPAQPLATAADHRVQQPGVSYQYQTATPLQSLGIAPAPVDCPACRTRHMTRIDYTVGGTTWAWAAAVCCLCGCGCIPFFINSCKNVKHFCGGCGAHVATYHRNSPVEVHMHH